MWTGPSAITFGHDGKPLFMQGPNDNAAHVMRTLQRTVGEGNFQFVMGAAGLTASSLHRRQNMS